MSAWSRNNLLGNLPKSLQFNWQGTQLGIRVEGEENFTYVDLQGPQGLKGDKGDKGDMGATGATGPQGIQGPPGPADWNALPDINPKAFEYSQTQTFRNSPGLIIRSNYPLLKAESSLTEQDDFWLYFYQNRAIIMRDRDKDGSAELPHPLDLRDNPKELYIYQARTWHSENFPQEKGNWNPYPDGTGWGYTSRGTYSRQGNHVTVRGLVQITSVGTSSVFQLRGVPFIPVDVSFCACRVRNLAQTPSDYHITGYVVSNFFRPQFIYGNNADFANMAMSDISSTTEVWFFAAYEI